MGLENPLHILILLVVVLLVFGAKRLPEMGHSLGSGLRGFKDALSGDGPDQAGALSGDGPRAAALSASATPAPAPAHNVASVVGPPQIPA
jgi:sec-independent protein translocase protein TatA